MQKSKDILSLYLQAGYQVTQQRAPLAEGGLVVVGFGKDVSKCKREREREKERESVCVCVNE